MILTCKLITKKFKLVLALKESTNQKIVKRMPLDKKAQNYLVNLENSTLKFSMTILLIHFLSMAHKSYSPFRNEWDHIVANKRTGAK